MKVAITGAGGFLGFHVRAAALEAGIEVAAIAVGDVFDETAAREALAGASRLIHIAGVNRGTDEEVSEGNSTFAAQLASVLDHSESTPTEVVFANSIQAGNGSAYGTAKQAAAATIAACCERIGARFTDVLLPNLFGEYGRPFYNSVVATFSFLLAHGDRPEVLQDKELPLLHAQNAADVLLGHHPAEAMQELCQSETVAGLKALLGEFAGCYSQGEIPDISTSFRRDLFNTFRSYTFPADTPVPIVRHADERGSFFEILRSRGGTGQTSFSTTNPGVTRGDHFHRRKVERFTILAGEAEISLRRLFDDRVYTYRISGSEPQSVDMPTMYAHNIRNAGTETLYTAFWTNDIFDPANPDTIPETV